MEIKAENYRAKQEGEGYAARRGGDEKIKVFCPSVSKSQRLSVLQSIGNFN